ncbi:MAG: hypothetical protein PHS96_09260 [Anaerolineales bacterium]|nr:hypothetical protein [Anaerolineales bacterium]
MAKSDDAKRSVHIKKALSTPAFKGNMYYALYKATTDYADKTIQTTVRAVKTHIQEPYKATIIVDGLRKSERRTFATQLRKRGIRTQKVRGATEQADIFVRLADALCGFLRDALTGRKDFRRFMDKAITEGYLSQIGE